MKILESLVEASLRCSPSSFPQYSVYDMLWAKCHRYKFFFQGLRGFFPQQFIFPTVLHILDLSRADTVGLPKGAKPRDPLSLRSYN